MGMPSTSGAMSTARFVTTMPLLSTLAVLVSVLPATAIILTEPHADSFFPGMSKEWPEVKHLVLYDLVLGDRSFIPDGGVAERRPDYYCRYDHFLPLDLEALFKTSSSFKTAFVAAVHNQDLVTSTGLAISNFWVGNFYKKFWTTYLDFFDGHHLRRTNVYGGTVNPARRQMCIRLTHATGRPKCGMKRLITHSASRIPVLFHTARDNCKHMGQGFDLPTANDIAAVIQSPRDICKTLGTILQHSWVQADKYDTRGAKNYFCMGCYVHFRDMTGVKSLDSHGRLVCKYGFVAEVPENTLPVCRPDGYWDMNTVGRCRRTVLYLGKTTYFIPLMDGRKPINFANITHAMDICKSGTIVDTINDIWEDGNVKTALQKMLASWGGNVSVWIGNDGDGDYYLNFTGMVQNKLNNGRHFILCRNLTTCTVKQLEPWRGYAKIDYDSGVVTCNTHGPTKSAWVCPRGDTCGVEERALAEPICVSPKKNIPSCISYDANIVESESQKRNVHLSLGSGHVRCKSTTAYEHCPLKEGLCSGGPGWIPFDLHNFTRLPYCDTYEHHRIGSVDYYISHTKETAELAKWNCQQSGMHLYSELHHRYIGAAKRITYSHIWIENSKGLVRELNLKINTAKPTASRGKNRFICVKYMKFQKAHPLLDVAYPETCSHDALIHEAADGFDQCVDCRVPSLSNVKSFDKETGLVTCQTGYMWKCPTGNNCARPGQPTPRQVCGGSPRMWTNVAQCEKVTPTVRKAILDASQKNGLNIVLETASVDCQDTGMIQECALQSGPCSGGPLNVPVKGHSVGSSPVFNLPRCRSTRTEEFGGVTYVIAAHLSSSSMASWFCDRNGMHLLSERHVKRIGTMANRLPTLRSIWYRNDVGQVVTEGKGDHRLVVCIRSCISSLGTDQQTHMERCINAECMVEHYSNMQSFDAVSGHVTCKPGSMWHCSEAGDGCPRPKSPVKPRCNSNTYKMDNVARCIATGHPPTTPHGLRLDKSTGSVACANDHDLAISYESCPHADRDMCAGGPLNIPFTNPDKTWRPLPMCLILSARNEGGVEYYSSGTKEHAHMAKWACEANGMHLTQHLHYTYRHEYGDFSNLIFNDPNPIWLESSAGEVSLSQNLTLTETERRNYKANFHCVKYQSGVQRYNPFVDHTQYPMECMPTYRKTTVNGIEHCKHDSAF